MSTSIAPSQWRVERWKNGRGTTSVVVRIPDAEPYRVRLSVADVTESGPFSTFPGYLRWSLLLAGGPIALGDHVLAPAALYEIDGATALRAHVTAPGRLLNVLGRDLEVGLGDGLADISFDLTTHVTDVRASPAPVTGHVLRIRVR